MEKLAIFESGPTFGAQALDFSKGSGVWHVPFHTSEIPEMLVGGRERLPGTVFSLGLSSEVPRNEMTKLSSGVSAKYAFREVAVNAHGHVPNQYGLWAVEGKPDEPTEQRINFLAREQGNERGHDQNEGAGKRDALASHLTETVQLALREPGTLLWTVHLSPVEADVVWLYKVYADEEARDVHESSAEYSAAKAQTGGLLAGPPEVFPLIPVAGKGLAG